MHYPTCAKPQLSAFYGTLIADYTKYCQLDGSRQYLALNCPDIVHPVQLLSSCIKHNLFYLNGTVYYFHDFWPSSRTLALHAFSDVDWAGCPDTSETKNNDVSKF